MPADQHTPFPGGPVSRRALLGAPALAVVAGVVGAGVLGTPRTAQAAGLVYGLPATARDVGLITRASFTGFDEAKTYVSFRMPGDTGTTVRSRLYRGEWYSADDLVRLQPVVEYNSVSYGGAIELYGMGQVPVASVTRRTHQGDARRLDEQPDLYVPRDGTRLASARTRGAAWVEYLLEGRSRYAVQWHDTHDHSWRGIDIDQDDPRWRQFESGFTRIRNGNRAATADLTALSLNISWAGNITAGSGLAAAGFGGFGLCVIAGLMLYGAYYAITEWNEGAEYMRQIWPR